MARPYQLNRGRTNGRPYLGTTRSYQIFHGTGPRTFPFSGTPVPALAHVWWPLKSNVVGEPASVSMSQDMLSHKNNMTNLADAVVVDDDIVVDVADAVIFVVVAFMPTDVVLLIGGVAAVVVRLELTSGCQLSDIIVSILAKHIAQNITSQMIVL